MTEQKQQIIIQEEEEEEEEHEYTPFDEYEEDGVRIMSFYTDETHFAETQIFRYYDNKNE